MQVFLDSRKLSWNSLLLDSRELIHWLPLNHRKWGFADNYLYFLEDIWMSVDFNIFVLKDNLFIDKMYFIRKLEYLADLSCWVWHCFLCLQWASGSWIKDSAMYPDKILAACSPKLKQLLTHFLFSFSFFFSTLQLGKYVLKYTIYKKNTHCLYCCIVVALSRIW